MDNFAAIAGVVLTSVAGVTGSAIARPTAFRPVFQFGSVMAGVVLLFCIGAVTGSALALSDLAERVGNDKITAALFEGPAFGFFTGLLWAAFYVALFAFGARVAKAQPQQKPAAPSKGKGTARRHD